MTANYIITVQEKLPGQKVGSKFTQRTTGRTASATVSLLLAPKASAKDWWTAADFALISKVVQLLLNSKSTAWKKPIS